MRKELNIGLFGFGCVGFGLYEVLNKTPTLKANIKKICVKSQHKQRQIPLDNFTFNKADLLDDTNINVIVELIDDADAAFEIVKEALIKGKAVVTANKKMIAEHFEELLSLQLKYKVPVLYEASCCASIPIIRNLEEYYDNDLLESIEGIVNGSTNFILTKTGSSDMTYGEALIQAQKSGFAESDPSLDTGGFDSKYKLLILLAHAFGILVKPDDILNLGIDGLGPLEIKYAKEKACKIKLIAQAVKLPNGQISAFVLPKFISAQDKMFQVENEYNGILTKTAFSETQFFMGKGAGAYPTASAVISDISALAYDYKYEYKKLLPTTGLNLNYDSPLRIFLRFENTSMDNYKEYFQSIQETYCNSHQSYIIGVTTLEHIRNLNAKGNVFMLLLD